MEGMERDERVGQHPTSTRGSEGREAEPVPQRGPTWRRVYALVNITHGRIAFGCFDSAEQCVAVLKCHPHDNVYVTGRVAPSATHDHDEQGRCHPRNYTIARGRKLLAR